VEVIRTNDDGLMDREGKAARRRRFVEVERRGRRFEMGEKRARGGRKVAEGGVVGWWRVRKVARQGELSDSEFGGRQGEVVSFDPGKADFSVMTR